MELFIFEQLTSRDQMYASLLFLYSRCDRPFFFILTNFFQYAFNNELYCKNFENFVPMNYKFPPPAKLRFPSQYRWFSPSIKKMRSNIPDSSEISNHTNLEQKQKNDKPEKYEENFNVSLENEKILNFPIADNSVNISLSFHLIVSPITSSVTKSNSFECLSSVKK